MPLTLAPWVLVANSGIQPRNADDARVQMIKDLLHKLCFASISILSPC